ncbi:MAG: hypothetical protein PHE49_08390 [bacterium]|nr:hypothetical protein [bacterium]
MANKKDPKIPGLEEKKTYIGPKSEEKTYIKPRYPSNPNVKEVERAFKAAEKEERSAKEYVNASDNLCSTPVHAGSQETHRTFTNRTTKEAQWEKDHEAASKAIKDLSDHNKQLRKKNKK